MSAASTPQNPARRILIVDDNADVAESFAMLLELLGKYETRTALDGPTALQLVPSFQPHIAFIDIGLPGLDGYEVARRLRGDPENAGIVLIALSGRAQDETRQQGSEAGFDHFLVKPVELDSVRSLLNELSMR